VFSVRTGREVAAIRTRNTASMVWFSRDGTTLISACHDGTVRSWDVATWRPAGRTLEVRDRITSAALPPDERLLAVGLGDGALVVWERASGREVRRIQAYSSPITGLAFAPDGRTLASVSPNEQTLALWDVPQFR
jgi:WD40 repeat protein